jgi:hypothetical protein
MDLQAELQRLLKQWEKDRRGLSTSDWQDRVADTTLSMCINELRALMARTSEGSMDARVVG